MSTFIDFILPNFTYVDNFKSSAKPLNCISNLQTGIEAVSIRWLLITDLHSLSF